jgi:pyridoxine 5-phosphate synthase
MTGADLRLYVNIDHVATLRQARKTDEPDPVAAARYCEEAGADGITVHLREDRRHIQDADVERLSRSVRTVLNLELATSEEIVGIACRLHPYQATLVPERREEVTTEGGLDLSRPTAIETAAALQVPAVELHTGRYAHGWRSSGQPLEELRAGARHARALGLAVHAGHGLTYLNVEPVAGIAEIEELNIGHSIMSRAILTGMTEAVTTMGRLVRNARRSPIGAD